jgi:hypothetical protein
MAVANVLALPLSLAGHGAYAAFAGGIVHE